MVDAEIITQRLERLKGYVKKLKDLLKIGKRKVIKDDIKFAALERFLQLATECVLDVGNHIIAGLNLRKPATYDQIFGILVGEKVISKKAWTMSKPISSLRNLLVHDYSPIKREDLFDSVKDTIPSLEELAKAYRKFL